MYISVGTITVILLVMGMSPATRGAVGRWGAWLGGALILVIGVRSNDWWVAGFGTVVAAIGMIAVQHKEKADAVAEAARKARAQQNEKYMSRPIDPRFDHDDD